MLKNWYFKNIRLIKKPLYIKYHLYTTYFRNLNQSIPLSFELGPKMPLKKILKTALNEMKNHFKTPFCCLAVQARSLPKISLRATPSGVGKGAQGIMQWHRKGFGTPNAYPSTISYRRPEKGNPLLPCLIFMLFIPTIKNLEKF